jgi:transcriptional antiterminator NusG
MLNWYAIYVRSRHEFASDYELRKKGITTYLPSIKRISQWKDRKKLVEYPLFPGYLFVLIGRCDSLKVLKTRGVVSLVSSEAGSPAVVPEEEITSLQALLASGEEINIYPEFKEGSLVFVKKGALKGANGVIVKKEGQFIFLVNIHILGRSVGVKIYADDLEAA